MDALIRWLDAKQGRRLALSHDLNLTRSGVSQMLNREYLRTPYIEKVHEVTGIPLKYLVRRIGHGLGEMELTELDAIARKRELVEQEQQLAEQQAKLRGK